MQYDKNNVFYKIINKELNSNFILDEKHFIAIHDIAPRAPIHVMVIPKGCYVDYYDFITHATDEEILDVNKGIAKIIEMMNLAQKGYRLLTNSGKSWTQEIMHLHIHIMGNVSE
ncbi:MAG: HIT domain-containing protein [Holosporales bacterium]|jgi:diadenosine tetraphosphate (Ap4A) HIT family hydrolase|nr:HIT domain-containing protein [Holosporales bacterium]